MNRTPAELGYRMPAEWEPHRATWIAWPHHREDWPGKFGPIPWVYCEITRYLSKVEDVCILVNDLEHERQAVDRLDRVGVVWDRVHFHRIRTDRVWTRDTGPIFVVNDRSEVDDPVGAVDFRFNGWAKYENYRNDNRVTRKIAKRLEMRRWKPRACLPDRLPRVVLEGGSIDVNGRGALLTTEECLLSPIQARNPGLSRQDLERVFEDYLGARRVVWLNRGIAGDDTHGHVDDIARFVNPRTAVAVVEPNPLDENHEPLRENLARLKAATDQDGRRLDVVELPMPEPVVFEGQRLPASYANFYIADGLVLAPTFNDPADRRALSILESLFPDRRVIGIHCLDLVWGLGTIHCMTQQEPAVRSRAESSRGEID